jgi:hypothetical protein
LLLLLPAAAGCNTKDSGTIQLVTGGETDTFTQAPVPTTLQVQAIDTSGKKTTIASVPFPAANVDLGDQSESSSATLAVSALDSNNNNTLIYGASLLLDFGAAVNATVPIFVQRVGQCARMPGTLDARTAPILSQVQGQFLFVVGGNESALARTSQLYDFALLTPLGSPPVMPVVPVSIAVVGTIVMLFDASGGATYMDLSQNATAAVPALPGSYTFADVAGGQAVVAPDGTTYVVGGTRTTGKPTAAVLKINPSDTSNPNYVSGNLSWLSLSAPRFGAAATWVKVQGLVVAGGSATAPGVEVLNEQNTAASPLPYPPDPTIGAGAATTDDTSTVVLAGGLDPTGADPGVRAISLSCTTCAATTWSSLPTPIGTANAFDIDSSHLLAVGNELGSGLTHVFLLTSGGSVTEIPTKVPHTNANALVTPIGSVVIVGGNAQMESVQLLAPAGP